MLSLIGARDVLRSRGVSPPRHGKMLYSSVVMLQIGLAVVLLIAAGLLGRSLGRLMSVDPGFAPKGLASSAFDVPATRAATGDAIERFQAQRRGIGRHLWQLPRRRSERVRAAPSRLVGVHMGAHGRVDELCAYAIGRKNFRRYISPERSTRRDNFALPPGNRCDDVSSRR
jgi:hypothetical protein